MIVRHLKNPLLLIGILFINMPINPKAQLTLLYNFGRLGDVFTDIARNIYLAQKYDLDFRIHNKIPYLKYFVIDTMHDMKSLHKRKKRIYNEFTLRIARSNTLYITYRLDFVERGEEDLGDFLFKHYIENMTFQSEVDRYLSLKERFERPIIPDGYISVAVHVRKGSGRDTPLLSPPYPQTKYSDVDFPLKFPPEQYYANQIIFLQKILDPHPLYIRIFTDDTDPTQLIQRIQQRVPHHNILFEHVSHNSEIKDLHAMSCFDFLIRPVSCFSQTAQFIGKQCAIIAPAKYRWENDFLYITESIIFIPDRKQHVLYTLPPDSQHISDIKHQLHIHNLFNQH